MKTSLSLMIHVQFTAFSFFSLLTSASDLHSLFLNRCVNPAAHKTDDWHFPHHRVRVQCPQRLPVAFFPKSDHLHSFGTIAP